MPRVPFVPSSTEVKHPEAGIVGHGRCGRNGVLDFQVYDGQRSDDNHSSGMLEVP